MAIAVTRRAIFWPAIAPVRAGAKPAVIALMTQVAVAERFNNGSVYTIILRTLFATGIIP